MPFTAAVLKYDPYRKFKFLVKWDNQYVAGVSKISALTKSVEAIDWRTGGDHNTTAKVPGLTKYEPITLERGLCADTRFMEWMKLVNTYQAAGGTTIESAHNFRKDLIIELYDATNEKVMSVSIFKAWPSRLTVADFDANSNELAIESLQLQHEGWQIDERPVRPDER